MRQKLLEALKHSGNKKLESMFVNVIRAQKEHGTTHQPKEQK